MISEIIHQVAAGLFDLPVLFIHFVIFLDLLVLVIVLDLLVFSEDPSFLSFLHDLLVFPVCVFVSPTGAC